MARIFVLLILTLFSCNLFAGVEISNFSFIGKEITNFNIRPVYKNINVDFKKIKKFDTYIEKLNFEVNNITKDKYTTKDPGFMYSGEFGTALSSAFIGSRAYRNYLAKMYLNKDYLSAISGYEKYEKKLIGSDFKDECTFLYAISLMKIGYYQKSIQNLKELSSHEGKFGKLAQEYLFDYYKEVSKFNEIIELSKSLEKLTPYTLYIYVDSLFNFDKYDEILKVLNNYKEYMDKYNFFYDYYIYSEYVLKEYDKVIDNEGKGTSNSFPVFIDVYLSKKNYQKAIEYINKLSDKSLKKYFTIKKKIYQQEYLEALTDLSSLKNEDYKSNLFFEFIFTSFPNTKISYLDKFTFNNPQNLDYKNFYKGLLYLNKKDFLKAASSFEKITFNDSLMKTGYFYKGLSYFYINKSLAEANLKEYILNGKDKQKLNLARYLLARIYINKKERDAGLMVLENCSSTYCEELKGEIFILNNEYDIALEYLNKLNTDRGNYLKAVIYYNRKNFEQALNFIKLIKKPDFDSEYLLMSIYFKLNKPDMAYSIVEKHRNNKRFFDTALNFYFLKGFYSQVLYLIETSNLQDDKYKLFKAKSLYSLKRYDEAEIIYNELLKKNRYIYDSIFGLININRIKNKDKNYIKVIFETIKSKNFDRKDQLILELAKESVNQNKLQDAIYIINYYFDSFPNARNNKDAYLLRGNIFKNLKRYNECIKDADFIILKFINADDAYLLKAECLENIDNKSAISTYEKLLNSDRFENLAKKKLLELYDDPDKVIQISNTFLDQNNLIYFKGIEKALNLVGDNNKILNYKTEVDNLLNSEIKEYVLSGLYFSSLIYYYNNDFKNAVKYAMKTYYLGKNSKYNKLSLQNAIRAYEKLGNTKNVEKIKQILKKIK